MLIMMDIADKMLFILVTQMINTISVDMASLSALGRLKDDIDPRYFWISLRFGVENETIEFYRDRLDFEICDF